MPASTKPAAAKTKAAAARAESNGGTKSCEWRGLQFTLPEKLPATVAFDIAAIEAAEDDDLAPTFQFVGGLIGSEQLAAVRAKVAEDGDSIEDLMEIFESLMDAVFGAYGVSLGE